MLITNKLRENKGRIKGVKLDSKPRMPTKRHQQGHYPLCAAKLERTEKGGRRKYSCQSCGATRNLSLTCQRCITKRVWSGEVGSACAGCGAKYPN